MMSRSHLELDSIEEGTQLQAADLKEWFKRVDRLKVLAKSFNEVDALERLDAQIQRMNLIYRALTGDNNPSATKGACSLTQPCQETVDRSELRVGLSKNLRDALRYLASREDVSSLLAQLAGHIELHQSNAEGLVELDLEPEELVDWEEGTEHLQGKTQDELYDMLGFKDKKIPFLVTEIDPDDDIGAQAHSNESTEESAPPPAESPQKQPFALKWHQLVGVTKLIQCAFTSRPVLLMDNVGLGKTLEVIAFFAVIAYYRQFYSKSQRYPGMWGEPENSYHNTQCFNVALRLPGVDQLLQRERCPPKSSISYSRTTVACGAGRRRVQSLPGKRRIRCDLLCSWLQVA
jgi:hypothetical protein